MVRGRHLPDDDTEQSRGAAGGVPHRRWEDVRGILSVRAERLDFDYVRDWSDRLGISGLLDRLLAQE